MTTLELLSQLRHLNVRIWVEGGHVRYSAPKGALSPDLQSQIVSQKEDLQKFLHEAESCAHTSFPQISRTPQEGPAPLSLSQRRLWFLDRLHPNNKAYNIVARFSLVGMLDKHALERSLDAITQRHEILRTVFPQIQGDPKQVILPSHSPPCRFVDLRSLPEGERVSHAQRLSIEESRCYFKLGAEPPWRFNLIQMADDIHQLVLTIHHIISDGWSIHIFFGELSALYDGFATGRTGVDLEPPSIQYRDYASWQHQWIESEHVKEQLAYWKEQLSDHAEVLALPSGRFRPPVPTFEGRQESLALLPSLTEKVKQFSQREGVTVFMTLLAVFQLVLHRYSGQDDIVVGTPVAGRNLRETEGLIGLFVNTLPIRVNFFGNPTFRQLLQQTRQLVIDAQTNQDVPFEEVVEEVNPQRSLSHSPLFQVMFAFEHTIQKTAQFNSNLIIAPLAIHNDTSKFDLTLVLEETSKGISGGLEYSTDLFTEEQSRQIIGHFLTALEHAIDSPEDEVSRIPILTKGEWERIVREWNDTETTYPKLQCLHELFEQQVDRNPQGTAVVSKHGSLTYAELNARANELAHQLIAIGVQAESLVGLCVERSLDLVVGCLGILKAGGAFVPLDPGLPHARLTLLVRESELFFLVSHETQSQKFHGLNLQTIHLDSPCNEFTIGNDQNPAVRVAPGNLAYVLYTSGTTGRPKGVMVEHRSIVNYIAWCSTYYPVQEGVGTPLHSSLSFDLSLTSLFVPLLTGKQVILFPEERNQGDLPSLWDVKEPLNFLKVTPSQLQILNMQLDRRLNSPSIHALILGGEALNGGILKPWRALEPGMRIINEYGPTETVVGCCAHEVSSQEIGEEGIPIGRPIANTKVYILDKYLQPVPVGVPGELYIGGHGVARGYLNQPELTLERFIPNPFEPYADERLYRTGDCARYSPDGNIEFLGRLDRQCKVRGFRVEPGEIESLIKQNSNVRDVLVVVREDRPGDQQLIAYVVPLQKPFRGFEALKESLALTLPRYLVPSAIVEIDELPLAPSGKVDHSRLPQPDAQLSNEEELFVAPRDELELQLLNIWKSVLGRTFISITDNFFDLGGHSLLTIKMVETMEKVFGKTFPLSILFQAPTIEQLAALIRHEGYSPSWSSLVPIQPGGSKPPFFCVHEGTGNVLCYRDLAHCLGPEQPFYGLQPVSLDGITPPLQTVGEMVECYLQEIRRLQPNGPYYLGGLCFGAYIALEIARTLEEQGETVGILVCFDTFGGQVIKKRRLGLHASPKKWENIKNFPRTLVNAFRYLMLIVSKGRQDREIPSKVQAFQQFLIRIISKVYAKLQVRLPLRLRRLRVWESIVHARKSYYPGVFSGRMTLFQATPEWRGFTDPADTWAESVLGGVEIHRIPGDHISIMKQPHVQILAKELSRCLGHARGQVNASS